MNVGTIRRIGLVFLGTLAAGCGDPVEPGPVLVPGMIEGFNEDDPRVSLVLDGISLTVEVVSYGGGCREKGELRVTVAMESHQVFVSPFDWENQAGVCDAMLRTFDHSTTIEIEEDGAWTIEIAGHDSAREPVSFDYSVEIGA